MDGGSTDETVDVLRTYGDRIRWVSEPDEGQSDALQKGFSLATHEWLGWLNSDDIQVNRALFHVDRAVRANPNADVVVGQGHYMNKAGEYQRPYPTIAVGPDVDVCHELFTKGYVAQPSVFFRRSVYERAGGVDRNLQFAMDYDLWVRLARVGSTFVGVETDISGNRWYAETKTTTATLPLLADVVAVQIRDYGRVSPFIVQAISDYLYQTIHANHSGDTHHLVYRTAYFKSLWFALNFRSPLYCARGLLRQQIAKSGPVVGDELSMNELAKAVVKLVHSRGGKFLSSLIKQES
ncbi:MAG: hypothetical protein A2341_08990 [Deltaproteobacteria bacterium RIFOXYB12_FULL_58_9]|nr:MAG: hypothetical protein A2341_08990 [Deltaproteobacteria bacterium RIFOXYB12_FULL_58_9]